MTPNAQSVWNELLTGNARFRGEGSMGRRYTAKDFDAYGRGQEPKAAVITCVDSRVAPEIIFDQPLGRLLVARVPGNVASESARWMLDIAVGELAVPLVLVVGHTGCRAVQLVLEGNASERVDILQGRVRRAVERVQFNPPQRKFLAAVVANALQTVEDLMQECPLLRRAVASGTTSVAAVLYRIETGTVEGLS